MIHPLSPLPAERRRQGGVAAVEMAIILPFLVMLLAFPLFFSRVLWHYTVAQKAAHDAARYFATVPVTEMMSPGRIQQSVDLARTIANEEMGDLKPGPYAPVTHVMCGAFPCTGFARPATITVRVEMPMYDDLFGPLTQAFASDSGLLIGAEVTMPYVGN